MLRMAKESISFAKYPTLLQLEEHHGVDVGYAYRMPDSAKSFTGSIYDENDPFIVFHDTTGQTFF